MSSGAPGSSATGAVGYVCGDGVVDPGEACDDGNNVNGDGCNQDCALPGQPQWIDYIAEGDYHQGEFWVLMLTSVLGMMVMASNMICLLVVYVVRLVTAPCEVV